MQRAIAFFSAASLVAIYAACAKPPVPFHQLRTPSGDFCSDMPIFAGRDQPDKEFHRLGPVQTRGTFRTTAERLESLRKDACGAGADAVIEASEDDVRQPDATFAKIASGTGIVWIRRPDAESKALGLGSVTGKKPEGEFKEAEPEVGIKDPTPLNTGVEVKSPPPPEPTATATSTAPASTSTAKTTTTTTTTTKTKTKK